VKNPVEARGQEARSRRWLAVEEEVLGQRAKRSLYSSRAAAAAAVVAATPHTRFPQRCRPDETMLGGCSLDHYFAER